MHDRRRIALWLSPLLLLSTLSFVAVSCGKKESTAETAENPSPSPAAAAPTVTDANIAAIVVAANNADVANGKEARDKTKNADVKSFANQMMVDHTAVNDKAEALAKKLDLTPEDNDASKGIKASQDSIRSSFESKKGVDYDRAYVDNEVAVHESVLKTIDDVLLPNVKSAELKQLITDTRPVIAMHLEHAKELQAKISVKTSK